MVGFITIPYAAVVWKKESRTRLLQEQPVFLLVAQIAFSERVYQDFASTIVNKTINFSINSCFVTIRYFNSLIYRHIIVLFSRTDFYFYGLVCLIYIYIFCFGKFDLILCIKRHINMLTSVERWDVTELIDILLQKDGNSSQL